jgi:hypothetical protein
MFGLAGARVDVSYDRFKGELSAVVHETARSRLFWSSCYWSELQTIATWEMEVGSVPWHFPTSGLTLQWAKIEWQDGMHVHSDAKPWPAMVGRLGT